MYTAVLMLALSSPAQAPIDYGYGMEGECGPRCGLTLARVLTFPIRLVLFPLRVIAVPVVNNMRPLPFGHNSGMGYGDAYSFGGYPSTYGPAVPQSTPEPK